MTSFGICEDSHKAQFVDRFLEWLAILKEEEEEEGSGEFDAQAFVENVRSTGISDSLRSEAGNVRN